MKGFGRYRAADLSVALDEVTLDKLEGRVLLVQRQMLGKWERELRLVINPRPAWCPEDLWRRLVRLVLVQEERP